MSCATETWGCRGGGDCKGGRGYKKGGTARVGGAERGGAPREGGATGEGVAAGMKEVVLQDWGDLGGKVADKGRVAGVQVAAKGWGYGERAGLQKRGLLAGKDWTVGRGWVEAWWDYRLRQPGQRQFITCGGEGQSGWAKPEPKLRKRWTGSDG